MATRAAPKSRKPVPAPEQAPVPSEPDEPGWAPRNLLDREQMFEDHILVIKDKEYRIRIRYLDTLEITRLQLLPDYAGYLTAALALQKVMKGEEPGENYNSESAGNDTVRYQVHVAHRAIVDTEHPGEVKCPDCNDTHHRSLWSMEQCSLLTGNLLDMVAAIAVRAEAVVDRVPFLRDQTHLVSSQPADTGESIPPTNS